MLKTQSKITLHIKNHKNVTNSQREKTIRRYQFCDNSDVEINQDFRAAIITVLHEVKVNILEMNRMREAHSRDLETKKEI